MIRTLKFLPLALFILAMLVVAWIAQLIGAPDPFAETEDEPEAGMFAQSDRPSGGGGTIGSDDKAAVHQLFSHGGRG